MSVTQAHVTQAHGLTCQWVPVSGEDGRVRMEMRWSAPTRVATRAA